MKTVIVAGALAAVSMLALSAAPASAQETTKYYGSLGYSQTDGDAGDLGTVTGRLGWRSNSYVGLEAEAGVGTNHADLGAGVNAKIDSQFAGYVTGTLPLNPSFDLIGRVGYGTTRIETNVGASDSLESVNYGAGIQWNISGPNSIRGDWTRYDYRGNGGEADVWSASYVRKF
ncbi:MAG: porin family protein [Caulobacteraceae bacterium]|nr:MAG: porin family protein [Caulobacteraceae bacterium]